MPAAGSAPGQLDFVHDRVPFGIVAERSLDAKKNGTQLRLWRGRSPQDDFRLLAVGDPGVAL
jgi:hypothetical protein